MATQTRPAPATPVDRRRARAARAVVAAGAVVAVLTGCAYANPPETSIEYAPSDGTAVRVGDVVVGNLMVLTSGEGEPGTVVGQVSNTGADDVEVTVAVSDDASVTLDVAARGAQQIGPEGDAELTLDAVPVIPGGYLEMTVTTPGEGSVTQRVPVLDGTLPPYDEVVPSAED